MQASKAADEHVCRGAAKSAVVCGVLSVAAVLGPHCVLGLSGPAKDWFSGMPKNTADFDQGAPILSKNLFRPIKHDCVDIRSGKYIYLSTVSLYYSELLDFL